jgi:mannose-6-phosphate isomerase-like protein (cupin superfamily)
MMPDRRLFHGQPIVLRPGEEDRAAVGSAFVVRVWSGSGPPWMHVHHSDDEAWHVLEGSLRFRFSDRELEALPGTTVFVPAGTSHTFRETSPSRYLMMLTPRLDQLIAELHEGVEDAALAQVFSRYDTELIDAASRQD